MTSLPNYLVTFTIFSLPSQTSTIRMPAKAFRRIEDEFCDSCTEELFNNGGCGIFFEDAQRVKDILYFVSEWCTTNCLSSLYSGCQRYCEEENNPGCDYQSCCTDRPSAVCYTEECINIYGYCCDVGAGTWTEVFRRLPGALPSSNPSAWYPAVFPSSDPSNLDDSKGTEIITTLPTLNPTTVITLMPVSAPTTVTTRSPTWTPNATSSTSLAPTWSPTSRRTGEPTRSPIFLPMLQPTMLPTSTSSLMPSYLTPNMKENTTLGVGDFCIANSDCTPMTCVEAIGGVEQEALTDDESCSTDTCYCNLASSDLQVQWVLQLCCIEEAHINQTIQPIAESLNVSDSAVKIISYWLKNTPSMRRQTSAVFTWDIIYDVSVTGDALALNQELSDENFLDRVQTAMEEDIGLPISRIITQEVSFYIGEPIPATTGSDTSIMWALAGAIGGLLLLTGLAYYISSLQTAAEDATSSTEISDKMIEEEKNFSGVPIRLGGDRFEL